MPLFFFFPEHCNFFGSDQEAAVGEKDTFILSTLIKSLQVEFKSVIASSVVAG